MMHRFTCADSCVVKTSVNLSHSKQIKNDGDDSHGNYLSCMRIYLE